MDNSSTLHNLVVHKIPFHIPLFLTLFIVEKRHHRNKYLDLVILNLQIISKILTQKEQHDAYTQHQTFFCYQNQKGTSNKFVLEIFNLYDPLYYNNQKVTNKNI